MAKMQNKQKQTHKTKKIGLLYHAHFLEATSDFYKAIRMRLVQYRNSKSDFNTFMIAKNRLFM